MQYYTIQGDTFDLISKKVYGSEKYIEKILNANQKYIDTIIFPENIELNIPNDTLVKNTSNVSLPVWRRND